MNRLNGLKRINQLNGPPKGGGISWASYCTPPSSLTATAVSETQIDLTWADSNTDEDGFRIYVSTDAINYIEDGTAAADATTYSVTGLTSGTLYYFKVVAYKGSAESTASNVSNEVTHSSFSMQSVQSATLSQVVFTYSMYVQGDIWIDWGNGTIEQLSAGIGLTKTSVYVTNNTTYDIRIYGALYHLNRFKIDNATCIADFAGFSKFVELEELYWRGATIGSTGNFNSLPSTLISLTLIDLYNSVPGAISSFPSGLEYLYCSRIYGLTGDLYELPSGLKWLSLSSFGLAVITHSINNLPSGLNYCNLYLRTMIGSISNYPAGLIFLNSAADTNNSTGSLDDLSKFLKQCTISGNNISAVINRLPSTLTTFNLGSSSASITANSEQVPVWASAVLTMQCALSTAELDAFLNAWQLTCGTGVKTINLAGSSPYNNQPRSSASDAAVTDMQTNHSKTFVFNT